MAKSQFLNQYSLHFNTPLSQITVCLVKKPWHTEGHEPSGSDSLCSKYSDLRKEPQADQGNESENQCQTIS